MQRRQEWPSRHSEPELVGRVPSELDGLLLLPSADMARGALSLHALRMRENRSVWYAVAAELPQPSHGDLGVVAELLSLQPRFLSRSLGWSRALSGSSTGARLTAHYESETALSWGLQDEHGQQLERGFVAVERARELADLFVAGSSLILLAVQPAGDDKARYQVGLATRRQRARVRWLSCERQGFPELLHAREVEGALELLLAVRASHEPGPAQLVRWKIDVSASTFDVSALLDFAIDWPTLSLGTTRTRDLAFGISAQSLAEDCVPELIKLDLASGRVERRSFGFARKLGCPSIARTTAAGGATERCFVLLPVYDAVRDATDCCTLDADALQASPTVSIRLPTSVRSADRTIWIDARRFRALDGALLNLIRGLR